MRILLTNDDGIHAEGMRALMRWASRIGETVVFAPKTEQSAKSHAIEIHRPFEAKRVTLWDGSEGWAVDSSPADCVRFAILGLHEQFDMVISGVNRGLNIGRDIMYSGTVAAAFEASALNVKAMAVSTEPQSFETAERFMDPVWAYIEQRALFRGTDIVNVNIPCETNGQIRLTHQGGPYYSDDFLPIGGDMYRPMGRSVHQDRKDFSLDTDAALNGYISVTPLTVDRTDLRAYEKMRAAE